MKVALKCFNRIYVQSSGKIKDTFTWIYVFPNEINPHYYDHYLASYKNPTSLTECLHIRNLQLTQKEIEKYHSILMHTKNVGAYICDYPSLYNDHSHKQYMIRDYSIKLE